MDSLLVKVKFSEDKTAYPFIVKQFETDGGQVTLTTLFDRVVTLDHDQIHSVSISANDNSQ